MCKYVSDLLSNYWYMKCTNSNHSYVSEQFGRSPTRTYCRATGVCLCTALHVCMYIYACMGTWAYMLGRFPQLAMRRPR